MKKNTLKRKMRELLCHAINTLLDNNIISLDKANEVRSNYYQTEVLGIPSVITWYEMTYDEVRISIWWGYKQGLPISSATEPLIQKYKYKDAVKVICSGFIERKAGKWLQGYGSDSIFDTFCAQKAREELQAIPEAIPKGYAKEGTPFFRTQLL